MSHADEHIGLSSTQSGEGRKTWIAAGGILGAIAASSCCILPLVLFSVGIVVTYDDSKTEVAALTLATADMGFPSTLKE